MDNSALSKMQLHYWEAKQTFLKKVKRKEDDCVVAQDAELDAKLELLKSIDETNQNLLNHLETYQDRVCGCAQEECLIGRFMRECGKVDPTRAGKLMAGSGKTLLFASHQFIQLRGILARIYRDVQTFQYRAVADTFDTVEQMEKARTAYRAALLWMKDLSKQLDPDAYGKMDKFKKVQEHVRKTKRAFEKLKMDSIQKIDLLSASRCNLFSTVLANYQNNLASIWDKSAKVMDIFVDTFQGQSPQSYEFTVLKELNGDGVDERFESFEARLKEILAQDNINEKDMLVFFEADYRDDDRRGSGEGGKGEGRGGAKPKVKSQEGKSKKPKTKPKGPPSQSLAEPSSSLLDFTTPEAVQSKPEDNKTGAKANLDLMSHFLPSSLIDLEHNLHHNKADATDELIKTDFDQLLPWANAPKLAGPAPKAANPVSKSNKDKSTNLETWLNLFADIDPLSHPSEFDKLSSDKNYFDRNC